MLFVSATDNEVKRSRRGRRWRK